MIEPPLYMQFGQDAPGTRNSPAAMPAGSKVPTHQGGAAEGATDVSGASDSGLSGFTRRGDPDTPRSSEWLEAFIRGGHLARLPGELVKVLLAVADFYPTIFPTTERLGELVGLESRSTLQRNLERLETLGYLETLGRFLHNGTWRTRRRLRPLSEIGTVRPAGQSAHAVVRVSDRSDRECPTGRTETVRRVGQRLSDRSDKKVPEARPLKQEERRQPPPSRASAPPREEPLAGWEPPAAAAALEEIFTDPKTRCELGNKLLATLGYERQELAGEVARRLVADVQARKAKDPASEPRALVRAAVKSREWLGEIVAKLESERAEAASEGERTAKARRAHEAARQREEAARLAAEEHARGKAAAGAATRAAGAAKLLEKRRAVLDETRAHLGRLRANGDLAETVRESAIRNTEKAIARLEREIGDLLKLHPYGEPA